MSRKGNPWDNAACESFMKTLKYEEVLRNEYPRLGHDARASIREFLEKVYNQKRLHSALGYLPPAKFEGIQKGSRCAAGFPVYELSEVSGKSFHPMEAPAPAANAPAHRLDEFPAGYSSAGCSPSIDGRLRFTNRVRVCAVMSSCRSSTFHRTANCVLTVCVTPGGRRSWLRRLRISRRLPLLSSELCETLGPPIRRCRISEHFSSGNPSRRSAVAYLR